MTAPPREGGFGRLAGRLVLAVLLLAALARLLGAEWVPIAVWAAALTPLLYLPAYPLAYLAARARAWPRLALALALVVAHLCWLAPVLLPAPPPVRPADRGQPLRLLTANLFQHNHRIDEMIAAVRAAEWCSSQLTVRSTTQRWRPSRSGDALLAPVRAATLTIR